MISAASKYIIVLACAFAFRSGRIGVLAELDDSNDLIYTDEELEALEKFRPMVIESMAEDFMESDFYLMRWIRMAKMDLDEAKSLFEKMVTWREDNNITMIVQEDWSDLMEDYHLEFSGTDKAGRPIGTIDLGDWDLRAASVTGKQTRLMRYLTYSLEKGMFDLFKQHAESSQNVSRGLVIVDAANLGLRTHLCPSCLGILANWIHTLESYYPQFLKEIIIINAPYAIKILHNALWPLMSSDSKNLIKSFNYNTKYWAPYLDERVAKEQRSPRYGGNREEAFVIPDHRSTTLGTLNFTQ